MFDSFCLFANYENNELCPCNPKNWPLIFFFLFWVSLWTHGWVCVCVCVCIQVFIFLMFFNHCILVYDQIVSSLTNESSFPCLWFPFDLLILVLFTFLLSYLMRCTRLIVHNFLCQTWNKLFLQGALISFSGIWCLEFTIWRHGFLLLLGYHWF